MNSFFAMLGLQAWKPVLTALLLPPVPWLVLTLIGARLLLPRRGLGWIVILTSVLLTWLSCCSGTAQALYRFALKPPPALTVDRIGDLRSAARSGNTAIIVLGAGMEPVAPEYRVADLRPISLERLRYGIWLGRETGLPVGFSGGIGWAQRDGLAEARIAERIAANEFGRPLKWVEDASRDTHENALRTVALLRPTTIRRIVLVTSGDHMPRALRDFQDAGSGTFRVEAAPMGLARAPDTALLTWMPSSRGTTDVREAVRELLGRLAGA